MEHGLVKKCLDPSHDGCWDNRHGKNSPLVGEELRRGELKEAQDVRNVEQFYSVTNGGAFHIAGLLKECAKQRDLVKGCKLHAYIKHYNLLENDCYVASALISMYARCGELAIAQRLLEKLPARDVVTWNALIAAYAQQGHGEEALKCFDSMQREALSPNVVTFICVLKACGITRAAARGKDIHDKILSLGILEKDCAVGNILIHMYASCGALLEAQNVFDKLPFRNVVSWNAIMTGYIQEGKYDEALRCFDCMVCEGYVPDSVTFTCALKVCGSIGTIIKGKQIHGTIIRLGLLEKDILLGSTLVDMYARCGALAQAQQVIDELPIRSAVSWTALIAGYSQQGQGEAALKNFEMMQHEGHTPDAVTFICTLKACGSIGAGNKGKELHDMIVTLGLLEKDIVMGSALADMYIRCGLLAKAQQVFDELNLQDVVSWTALIGGYAQQGKSWEALDCFETMQSEGIRPNLNTLACLLSAYGHSGLVDQAEVYFSRMNTEYGIIPDVEHYCCIIGLFSRAGKFGKAVEAIENMPSINYLPVWLALLGACCKWGDVETGRYAFDCALRLDKRNGAAYIYLANVYTTVGMHENADKIEVMRVANEAF